MSNYSVQCGCLLLKQCCKLFLKPSNDPKCASSHRLVVMRDDQHKRHYARAARNGRKPEWKWYAWRFLIQCQLSSTTLVFKDFCNPPCITWATALHEEAGAGEHKHSWQSLGLHVTQVLGEKESLTTAFWTQSFWLQSISFPNKTELIISFSLDEQNASFWIC